MNHIECDHYAALLYDRLLKSNHDRTALLDDVDKSRRLLRASQGFEAELRAALTQADALGYARGREEAFIEAADMLTCRPSGEQPLTPDSIRLRWANKMTARAEGTRAKARAITAEPAKPCDVDDDLKCRTHPNGCEAWEPAKEVK